MLVRVTKITEFNTRCLPSVSIRFDLLLSRAPAGIDATTRHPIAPRLPFSSASVFAILASPTWTLALDSETSSFLAMTPRMAHRPAFHSSVCRGNASDPLDARPNKARSAGLVAFCGWTRPVCRLAQRPHATWRATRFAFSRYTASACRWRGRAAPREDSFTEVDQRAAARNMTTVTRSGFSRYGASACRWRGRAK
jgi:hypothetical protein